MSILSHIEQRIELTFEKVSKFLCTAKKENVNVQLRASAILTAQWQDRQRLALKLSNQLRLEITD